MTRTNPRRAALVARLELRRTWRSLRGSTRGLLLLAGGCLMLPLYSLAIGVMALFGGREIASSDPATVRLATTGILAFLVGLVAFMVVQRTIKTNGEPDAVDGLLTTAPYADIAAGLLGAELCRMFAIMAGPLLALTVGLTVGSGLPLLGAATLATTGVVVALAVLGSYAAGLAVKLVAARSEFVARHRATLGGAASLALVLFWILGSSALGVQLALLRAATQSPLSWTGDIVLLTVPGVGADALSAAVAATALLGSVPLAGVASLRLAERLWYADPVQPAHEFDAAERTLSDRLLDGRVSTPTRVVAQKSWLRAKRAPFTVQFAIAPFFLLALQFRTVLLGGTVPPTLPLTAGLASTTAAGAAFTLNPLGGEERVLPLTLTADISGRAFVTGLALAGAVPGVVLTALLVVGFGLAAGSAPATLGVTLLTTLVATVTAPAIAAAAGVVFPKFDRSSVGNREVTLPSGFAFGFYASVLGIVVAPGSIAVWLAVVEPFALPLSSTVLLASGLAVTVALAAVAGSMGFLYAANRVGTYRLE
ncbi:hypothetical protein NDI56_14745 [Haloarcula sp. S1CR25-12]|uniref:ABC transporter permease n=1 Tax=Haloarcula saliterrae TaxID=2950534 RepID=A0ABU2FEK2_9EURY|nr:hypothetical protein [Haloarcula sp. S1CR25-12]MDS0260662.1 hypothetical protein [Haloarcula sp. S1CR25-12]